MLIVYDCLFPWTIGGAERWYRALADRLAAEGHAVTYLTLRQWPARRASEPQSASRGSSETGAPPAIPGVAVVSAGPQLALYAEGRRRLWPPLRFGLGVAGHLLRHGREYDIVHTASFPYWPVLVAAALQRWGGYRLLVDWWEVWTRGYWQGYAGPLTGAVGWLVQRLAVRVPQQAFVFSRLHAARLRAEGYRGPLTELQGVYAGPAPNGKTSPPNQTVACEQTRGLRDAGLKPRAEQDRSPSRTEHEAARAMNRSDRCGRHPLAPPAEAEPSGSKHIPLLAARAEASYARLKRVHDVWSVTECLVLKGLRSCSARGFNPASRRHRGAPLATTSQPTPGETEAPARDHPAANPVAIPTTPFILYVGRHIPEKRVPAIIPALARARGALPDLSAVITGDGPTHMDVATAITDANLAAAVSLPGIVDESTLDALYRAALCLILPSQREGYGLVVVEAAARGTPSVVVAGPDNAATELIEPGVNGFIAPSVAAADLASAILDVAAAGPGLRGTTAAWFAAHAPRLSLAGSLARMNDVYSMAAPATAQAEDDATACPPR